MKCAIYGCARKATWLADDGHHYCEVHLREFFVREDREDFAESYANDLRREREREIA